jgi:hypothetical protein
MINRIRIKDLLQYEVETSNGQIHTFTADEMIRDDNDVMFYRTGNLIRVFTPFAGVRHIVVTPVDDADIPE